MADTQLPPPRCALLGLPAELRDRIYKMALFEPSGIDTLSRWCHFNGKPSCSRAGEPGLVRSCRQIRNEALHLFYILNNFCTQPEYSPSLPTWLKGLSEHKLRLITRVSPGIVIKGRSSVASSGPYTVERVEMAVKRARLFAQKHGRGILPASAVYVQVETGLCEMNEGVMWVNGAGKREPVYGDADALEHAKRLDERDLWSMGW